MSNPTEYSGAHNPHPAKIRDLLKRVRLLGLSILYTNPQRLMHRLRLVLKRKILERSELLASVSTRAISSHSLPILSRTPTNSIFESRSQYMGSQSGDSFALCFQNRQKLFSFPVDWRPPELQTGTRLWLLHLHYHEFLEGADREFVGRIIIDWINNSPPYVRGYWLDCWNSYALSIRVVVWMQLYAEKRLLLSDEQHSTFIGSLAMQMRFLLRNLELDIGGNHLVKNVKALLWAANFFSGPLADQCTRVGEKHLRRELSNQILPDGMHFELSPTYHNQVFADLLECYSVLNDEALRDQLGSTLDTMAAVCTNLQHADGSVSLFGDSGYSFSYSPSACLSVYEEIRRRKAPTKSNAFELPSSGYYGMQSKSEVLIIDCGPMCPDSLPAHGHGDALAFEWSVGGQLVIVDTGVFEYNESEKRTYCRGTMAHNTVTLNDLDQSEFWKSFRAGRRARIISRNFAASENGIRLEGSHDGYRSLRGKPVHNRVFDCVPGRIIIRDAISGGSGQSAVARMLLHPDCMLKPLSANSVRVTHSEWQDSKRVIITASHPISRQSAFWNPDQGVSEPTNQLVMEYGAAPCSGDFQLVYS